MHPGYPSATVGSRSSRQGPPDATSSACAATTHPRVRATPARKAHRIDFYQTVPHRLTEACAAVPTDRSRRSTGNTAIREVAERFRGFATHGGESIFYYGGGGRGNHLPGAYGGVTRKLLLRLDPPLERSRRDRRSGSLAAKDARRRLQHCAVGLFIGKNPPVPRGIPRARVTLRAIARDPSAA